MKTNKSDSSEIPHKEDKTFDDLQSDFRRDDSFDENIGHRTEGNNSPVTGDISVTIYQCPQELIDVLKKMYQALRFIEEKIRYLETGKYQRRKHFRNVVE